MLLTPLLLLLLLTACERSESAAQPPQPQAQTQTAQPAGPCRQQAFDGSRFTICEPGTAAIELVAAASDEQPVRDFAELQARLGRRSDRVAFAMNAGMFDEEGRPIGLAIVGGKQVHAINRREGGGNFHLMPNGVFQVRMNGSAEIVPTSRWRPVKDIRFATQSGPMLVIDGKLHPQFDTDGTSRNIRNGVGICGGRTLFAISEEEVSFGKFARLFRDELKCRNALFFDGSVSALWDPANHRRDLTVPLGPMVVAFRSR